MSYHVNIINCPGVSDPSKRQAEGAFRQGLESSLKTGPAGVVLALAAYTDAINRHGGEPLPLDAPAIDRDAVDAWNEAYAAGRASAFTGWVRAPEAAYFEITPQ